MNNIFQDHFPLYQLADFAEGRQQPDEQNALETHLATCPQCHDQMIELKRLIELMRTDLSQDVPAYLIQRAIQLFQAREGGLFTVPGLRRRIQAVLQFDSMGLEPAFGMRSGRPWARQVLYSTGANEIDLRIEPTEQSWVVSGQVFGIDPTNGKVLLKGAADTSETTLNNLSEFVLPPVQAGVYHLILNTMSTDVEINELRIGL